ncbi:MAG: hypothetical protein QOK24_997 [Verrucomicrobiota bacterium]|jgi:hypothetical protein
MTDSIPPLHPSTDPRTALYHECWKAYYNAYYSHLLADLVAGRWQTLDQIAKLLVALFSTGSAVAGWSFWTANTGGKMTWAVCAGVATVLSIVQSALAVSDRLKTMLESRGRMLRIRLQFETLFSGMRLDPEFDVVKVREKFATLQQEYVEAAAQMPKDWIYTSRDEANVQKTLNQKLGV